MTPDRLVLGSRTVARILSTLAACGLWLSMDEPFSAWSVLIVLGFWFLLREVLVSLAALFFH